MSMIMIYEFVVPEMIVQNQNEPPILSGRHIAVPVVNCPNLNKGDKTILEVCEACEHRKNIVAHFVECDYNPSPKEIAEITRRRKGMGIKNPVQPTTKELPKNVFIPKN